MDCLTTGKAKLKAKKNKTPNLLLLVTPSKIPFSFHFVVMIGLFYDY